MSDSTFFKQKIELEYDDSHFGVSRLLFESKDERTWLGLLRFQRALSNCFSVVDLHGCSGFNERA